MKMKSPLLRRRGAFTLVEMLVAVAVMTLVGGAVYQLSSVGAILYAKNTAINVAHDQSRIAVARLVRDIHAAASIPQLGHIDNRAPGSWTPPTGSWVPSGTNVTFVADTGSGPSPGIGFQVMGDGRGSPGGPFNIKNDPADPNLIMIDSPNIAPQVGMRLIIPYYNMEDEINRVTSTGADHWNVFTVQGMEQKFKTKNQTYYICFYTSRTAYVVENGELRLYSSFPPPTGSTWPIVLTRNIINPADRTQPAAPFTQATTQYIGVNLTTEDSHYTNRGFKGTNTLVAGSIPYYSQICISQ
jgi:prepilin-type N-terminal cleavage/methylation domain-containing protein